MLRFFTAGESHGEELTAILEGMPSGIHLSIDDINFELSRRQRGFGSSERMKLEHDTIKITSGVTNDVTTGTPIALHIKNKDNRTGQKSIPLTIPRPGHADYSAAIKYKYNDFRLSLERASARETAMRVAVGAICRQLLKNFNILIGGFVRSIGNCSIGHIEGSYPELWQRAENNFFRCPDSFVSASMQQTVEIAQKKGDSLGGIGEVNAIRVPVGLGSHVLYDRRLDAKIAMAMMSIPSIKGIEIGDAFDNAKLYGSEVHDALYLEENEVYRNSNHAGGIEGGISNGSPIIVRCAIKPIPTLLCGIDSIDFASHQNTKTKYERSDTCAVPRVIPVMESMLAFVLAQELCEKLGGDSLAEMKERKAWLQNKLPTM